MAKEWFRSSHMEYISIIIREDESFSIVHDFGLLGAIQFIDLNPHLTPFQRKYVSMIKRCEEIEQKLRFIGTQISSFDISIHPHLISVFLYRHSNRGENTFLKGAATLEELEKIVEKQEFRLIELKNSEKGILTEHIQQLERYHVLNNALSLFTLELQELPNINQKLSGLYQETLFEGQIQMTSLSLLDNRERPVDDELRFRFLTGVINLSDRTRFDKMIFRATRGNCFIRFNEIEEPIHDLITGQLTNKLVFIIFYNTNIIEAKLRKICDSFSIYLHNVPQMNNLNNLKQLINDNSAELKESKRFLDQNRVLQKNLCVELANNLEEWQWTVLQTKSIYHTLNLFKSSVSGVLQAEGWVIASKMDEINQIIAFSNSEVGATSKKEIGFRNSSSVSVALNVISQPPSSCPPTHFYLNKFTQSFQDFVDTYGIPRYRELNPAVFTSATFPFLFGIMYGDIGHGLCIFLAGLYLISLERKLQDSNPKKMGEILSGVYSGRYMLTLMGLFAVYVGFVYNDCFSIGLNLFGSLWSFESDKPEVGEEAVAECTVGSEDGSCVYPFGVDPVWHVSENELLFFNSLKMKISIIIGIIQMTVGILMKGLNAIFFKQPLDFFFEFIPMIIFDFALFGYMVILVFVKWSINWDHRMLLASCTSDGLIYGTDTNCTSLLTIEEKCPLNYGGSGDGCQPPNLVTSLINIALSPGTVEEPMFAGQGSLQVFLLVIAFLCIPVLLFAKPCILSSRKSSRSYQEMTATAEHESEDQPHVGHHDEHSFGEIMIHQSIETIEFVLGMVSNTASYLRLWALSLAHTELASVFWEKSLQSTILMGNPIFIVVGYTIFAAVTMSVLLMMDVLECFLHALRLHWVEFQNKFYKADGYKFQPFCFRKILSQA